MKHRSRLFIGVIGLAVAGLTLAPTIAGARTHIFEGFPGTAITYGFYQFPCAAPLRFPGTPTILNAPGFGPNPSLYFSGLIASPAGCPGSFAYMIASIPAPGAAWTVGRVIGAGNAGLVAKLPSTTATTPDTLQDSLFVSVNRGTPGQVTLSITGYAKHLNPAAAPNGAVSRLTVAVYPDTTSAKNETGAIASGEMRFAGSASRTFSGFFTASDFTTPAVIGDGNDFIVSTTPGLQKVVTVPNAATAVVDIVVDPEGFTVPTGGAPASNPALLVALASLLLGGATWLLLKRNRADLA
jgi:hypothetical protein